MRNLLSILLVIFATVSCSKEESKTTKVKFIFEDQRTDKTKKEKGNLSPQTAIETLFNCYGIMAE